jgi:hypothetical protein
MTPPFIRVYLCPFVVYQEVYSWFHPIRGSIVELGILANRDMVPL